MEAQLSLTNVNKALYTIHQSNSLHPNQFPHPPSLKSYSSVPITHQTKRPHTPQPPQRRHHHHHHRARTNTYVATASPFSLFNHDNTVNMHRNHSWNDPTESKNNNSNRHKYGHVGRTHSQSVTIPTINMNHNNNSNSNHNNSNNNSNQNPLKMMPSLSINDLSQLQNENKSLKKSVNDLRKYHDQSFEIANRNIHIANQQKVIKNYSETNHKNRKTIANLQLELNNYKFAAENKHITGGFFSDNTKSRSASISSNRSCGDSVVFLQKKVKQLRAKNEKLKGKLRERAIHIKSLQQNDIKSEALIDEIEKYETKLKLKCAQNEQLKLDVRALQKQMEQLEVDCRDWTEDIVTNQNGVDTMDDDSDTDGDGGGGSGVDEVIVSLKREITNQKKCIQKSIAENSSLKHKLRGFMKRDKSENEELKGKLGMQSEMIRLLISERSKLENEIYKLKQMCNYNDECDDNFVLGLSSPSTSNSTVKVIDILD